MSKRNPESPLVLPPTPEELKSLEDAAKEATEKRFQKILWRRRTATAISKTALTALLFAHANVSLYLSDVRVNMLETEDARPSVTKQIEAIDPENADKATVFLHGFNTPGARHLVSSLGEGYQKAFDSTLYSVNYNNAPLNPNRIGELVNEKLERDDISSVNVVAYSQGDVPATDVAVDSIIANTTIPVENITIIAGPADFESLTEKTKEELGLAKTLAWIPWIEYSTPFRLGLEAYFYRNAIQKDPFTTSGGIGIRYNNGNMTTNHFLATQINSISDADVPAKIRSISQYAPTRHRPNINYIAIEENGNSFDSVVNNENASEKIEAAAEEAGLNFTHLSVNSRHGEFYRPNSVEEYKEAFAELATIVKPFTEQEAGRLALSLDGYYQDYSLLKYRNR